MKANTPTFLVAAAILGLAINLHSQGLVPKTPPDHLKELKAKNLELIEKQKATLLKLDEMEKQAEQIPLLLEAELTAREQLRVDG